MGSLISNRNKKLIFIAFIGILLLHIGISMKRLELYKEFTSSKPLLDKEEVSKILIKLKQTSKPKQIVNTVKSKNKKKSKDAKYLGKEDNFFYRETKSRRTDIFTEGAKGNSKIDSPLQQKENVRKKNKNVDLSKLSFNPLRTKQPIQKNKTKQSPKIQAAKKGTKFGNPNKRGIASNNDFIEDLPLGEFSRLNTQEYQFYGFYFRIRQRLEQVWGVSLKEKAKEFYRRGGRLPASQNLITDLEITLDNKGAITNVKIVSPSGVKELDEAAIDSFNNAGPFPNPPKKMLKNGYATIKWGFVVKG